MASINGEKHHAPTWCKKCEKSVPFNCWLELEVASRGDFGSRYSKKVLDWDILCELGLTAINEENIELAFSKMKNGE